MMRRGAGWALNVGHLGYRAVVMTLDEARSHIGSGVLYCTAADEAQHAVIARVLGSWVFVRCSSDNRIKSGRAGGSDAACRTRRRSRGRPDRWRSGGGQPGQP